MSVQQNIALFFGSFNPVHYGHLSIAQTVLNDVDEISEVWFVISPKSPFKALSSLAHEFDRFDMVKLAIEDNKQLQACDIEFNLPLPSYTTTTLTYLSEQYSNYKFTIIMGEDNLENFKRWKNYRTILDHYAIILYPRPRATNVDEDIKKHSNVKRVNVPLIDISATYIRKAIKNGKDVRYLVPPKALQFILDKGLYL